MSRPEIAVSVSTFERPEHLRRSLLSIAAQRDVAGRFELVVTDDGSRDSATQRMVEDFARQVDFPVHFTTHIHNGFQLSRCRNEGALATSAPYLLFTDGDCLLPPRHLWYHLQARRPGWVVAGDCYRMDRATTQQVTDAVVVSGVFERLIPRREKRRLVWKYCHSLLYRLTRRDMLPRLTGCNIGIWRSDYERVNGSDENYVGWGLEDRDLQRRLSRVGLRFKSILHRTAAYHLWHPPHETFARNSIGTANLTYYHRDLVLTRCLKGLRKRTIDDLKVRVIGGSDPPRGRFRVVSAAAAELTDPAHEDLPEVEILVLPGDGRFSGEADCQVLLVREHCAAVAAAASEADLVVDVREHAWRPELLSNAREALHGLLRKAA